MPLKEPTGSSACSFLNLVAASRPVDMMRLKIRGEKSKKNAKENLACWWSNVDLSPEYFETELTIIINAKYIFFMA